MDRFDQVTDPGVANQGRHCRQSRASGVGLVYGAADNRTSGVCQMG